MEAFVPHVAPAIVLSVLVGVFDSCLYVVLRGVIRPHLLALVPASIVGAYIGQAVGGRVGDPIIVGDFSLAWALVMSWVAILVVVGLASIMPEREPD
jgi:hypothetical protein